MVSSVFHILGHPHTLGSFLVTLWSSWITLGVTVGHLGVIQGYFGVILGHPEVTVENWIYSNIRLDVIQKI